MTSAGRMAQFNQVSQYQSTPVLATSFIRPELSGKRGLSWYFILIIIREQHDWQIPFLATRARHPLGKKYHPKK
jgi:hypothetical protein